MEDKTPNKHKLKESMTTKPVLQVMKGFLQTETRGKHIYPC